MEEHKIFKFGIIGCGHRATTVGKKLTDRHNNFKLDCVYDEMIEVITDEKRKEGVLYTNDLDQFIARDTDMVIIGSINCDHFKHILAVHGKKHIFCEKPIVMTEQEIKDLRTLTKESVNTGKLFGTGFVLRHSPIYSKIKEIIDSGEIGKLCSMNVQENLHYGHGAFINQNWRRHRDKSGGHVIEKCVHIIDLVNWYNDCLPKSAFAIGGINNWTMKNKKDGEELKKNHNDPGLFQKYATYETVEPYDDTDRDIEDTIGIVFAYKNGCVVNFSATSYSPNSTRRFDIIGTLGKIEAWWESSTAQIKIIKKGFGRKSTRGVPAEYKCIEYADIGCHGNGDNYIVDSLAAMVEHGVPMKPSFDEAINASEISIGLEDCIRSAVVE